MKIIKALVLVLAFFNAKSQTTIAFKNEIDSNTTDVSITLNKDTINYFGDLIVTIKVTNKSDKDQKVLFGKFKPGQIGPWATNVIIYNTATKETKSPRSPNFYSSQAYSVEDLKNDYTVLFKNNSVSKAFKMTDISTSRLLSNGIYQIQIRYCNVLSNKVNLVIDDKVN